MSRAGRAPAPARAWSFLALALAFALGCARERPHDDFPGMRLLAEVEEELEDQRDALRPMLEHYALVFPVTQEELAEFMQNVEVQGAGGDLALGTAEGVEVHAGGYLRLLLDTWRPEGREPALDDAFRFERAGRAIELRRFYEAGRQQLFLPYGKPNAVPSLPRMLIPWQEASGRRLLVDSDSYKLLSVLLQLAPDFAAEWKNKQGQPLRVDALMGRVRESYLAGRPAPEGPLDHSSLHVVELLVAYGRKAPGFDFAPIREHLLGVELAQDLRPEVANTLRAHHAESLGHLLGAPGLAWDAAEKERAKRWLRELEERHFPDAPDEVEPLSHLGRGLRLVREHRAVLE